MNLSSLPAVVQTVRLFHDQGQIQPMWYDSCVYFKQNDGPTYLLLYVNDMLIAARNKTHIQKLKAQLKQEFDMKNLGEFKKILGMEITRDRGSSRLWLSQEDYVLKVLRDLTWQK